MPQIDKYFEMTLSEGASDLHISPGYPPCIRVHGDLRVANHPPLTHEQNKVLLTEIMNERNLAEFKAKRQADFVYSYGTAARFRSNVYMQRRGIAGSFRVIPSKVLSTEELGLTEPMINLCKLHRGLVLVTGPTGSGKSTTLAAMIDHCNRNRKDHIITVEDPIEFVHQNKSCLVTQRQVGENVDSFADALRAALREDPDIILVGEMRDLETIQLAISAAETGHLVFGTLHTTSAAKTVDRIIDSFPVTQQEQVRAMLSESLKGIIAQVLLKRADGKGRVAAWEILLGIPALGNLIRDNKCYQIPSLMQTQRALGMQLLDQALMDLLKQRKISPQQALDYAVDKSLFRSAAAPERPTPPTG